MEWCKRGLSEHQCRRQQDINTIILYGARYFEKV